MHTNLAILDRHNRNGGPTMADDRLLCLIHAAASCLRDQSPGDHPMHLGFVGKRASAMVGPPLRLCRSKNCQNWWCIFPAKIGMGKNGLPVGEGDADD